MRVRALNSSNDWTYGSGRNNYKTDLKAVQQNIQTRLSSFLGDCFFATNEGIDWFNLLGAKNQIALNLAISSVILNTQYVTGILQLSANLSNTTRLYTTQWKVQTAYSVTLAGEFVYDFGTT